VTETREDSVTWLTQEAYDRLKAEFDHLSGQGRIDIAQKIEAAREEGDLRENGGYHAAKEEQGKIEGRILQLQHILENARVGGPPRTDGVVGPGMTVTVRFIGDEDEVTFLLASREESGSPIRRHIRFRTAGRPRSRSWRPCPTPEPETILRPAANRAAGRRRLSAPCRRSAAGAGALATVSRRVPPRGRASPRSARGRAAALP